MTWRNRVRVCVIVAGVRHCSGDSPSDDDAQPGQKKQ